MGVTDPIRETAVTDMNALESLYFAALEKPPAERPAFLDAACGTDADLRARVDPRWPSTARTMARRLRSIAGGRAAGAIHSTRRQPRPRPAASGRC